MLQDWKLVLVAVGITSIDLVLTLPLYFLNMMSAGLGMSKDGDCKPNYNVCMIINKQTCTVSSHYLFS